jgi:hypothetical protein
MRMGLGALFSVENHGSGLRQEASAEKDPPLHPTSQAARHYTLAAKESGKSLGQNMG